MRTWTPGGRTDPAEVEGGAPSFSVSLALRPHYETDIPPSGLLLDLVEKTAREGKVHSFFISAVAGTAGQYRRMCVVDKYQLFAFENACLDRIAHALIDVIRRVAHVESDWHLAWIGDLLICNDPRG